VNAPAMLSSAQIGAQLDAVLQRDPTAAVVAIRASSMGPWPEVVQRRGRSFRLRWCESRLALREALTEAEAAALGAEGLLLLTPLGDAQVPDDVVARLARGRVFQPKGWDILRQLFGANETDARLGRYEWMPEVLIDCADGGAPAPVPSGFLDLETAWGEVLRRCLGMQEARPDAATLMRWAQRADVPVLLGKLPAKALPDALDWLGSHAGPAGRLIVRCIEAGRAADAAPVGLVCDVVLSAGAQGVQELAQAAVRLERYVGDRHVSVAEGREWAVQVRRLLEHTRHEEARPLLERADALLRELRVAEFAHLSDWLPNGLEQRLARFARSLSAHAADPTAARAATVEDAGAAVLQHQLAPQQALRAERVRMARRLARWLLRAEPTHAGFDHAIAGFAHDGAFVDWARFKLLGGDELPELSAAYVALRATVTRRREQMNKGFAAALALQVKEARPLGARALAVETVLQDLVGRLAATHPVLLLVLDGLSLAIFRELFEPADRHGWVELTPEGSARPLVGLAALPTITEVSRASLLCGRITTGAAPGEKLGFAAHPALLACSNGSHPPRLFHKADLSVNNTLADDVRASLANPNQKVVGVVYNAVDDHLSGPEQLQQRWDLEELRLLLPLLREAKDSRRVIVVTADHGHTLEEGSMQIAGGASDRWRSGSQAAETREVALAGQRVLTPEGANEVVCIWSESARYTGRKNGYHGGASPAEVIVPLSVFAPFGVNVANWTDAPPQQPEWWDLPAFTAGPAAPGPVAKPAPKRVAVPPAGQPALFGAGELPVPQQSPPAPVADWVAAVFASAAYASQRQLAARVALPDTQMRLVLLSLDERGGKLTRSALAQRLAVPELRLAGILSAARRMLNIDQAPVLTVDEAAGMVELNRALLVQQFRAGAAGAKP